VTVVIDDAVTFELNVLFKGEQVEKMRRMQRAPQSRLHQQSDLYLTECGFL
jgi:hypothetical protein